MGAGAGDRHGLLDFMIWYSHFPQQLFCPLTNRREYRSLKTPTPLLSRNRSILPTLSKTKDQGGDNQTRPC